jgi:hypothetical protein
VGGGRAGGEGGPGPGRGGPGGGAGRAGSPAEDAVAILPDLVAERELLPFEQLNLSCGQRSAGSLVYRTAPRERTSAGRWLPVPMRFAAGLPEDRALFPWRDITGIQALLRLT